MGSRSSKPKKAAEGSGSGGVSLRYLESLVDKVPSDATCEDVCNAFVKPQTKGSGGSLFAMLAASSKTRKQTERKADYFVSYTWSSKYADVMAAVRDAVGGAADVFIWMDLFLVDQNKAAGSTLTTEQLNAVFAGNLKTIGKAIVVLTPLSNPVAATRSWCVFEWLTLVSNNIDFVTAVPPKDRMAFISDVYLTAKTRTFFSHVFSQINVEHAQAREPKDREIILEQLRKAGPQKVNDIAMNTVKLGFESALVLALSQAWNDLQRLCVYTSLGSLLLEVGQYEKALESCTKAVELARFVVGGVEEHLWIAGAYSNLANVYQATDKLELAFEYYTKSLEICERSPTLDQLMIRGLIMNIGSVHRARGNLDLALEMYLKALDVPRPAAADATLGDAYNNIAIVYEGQGKLDLSLEFYEKALQIRTSLLGEDHVSTVATYTNIATVYMTQGKLDLALEFFLKSLKGNLRTLGEVHSLVADCYNNIGQLYQVMGQFELSLEYSNKAVEIYSKTLGATHPKVGNAFNNIGNVYARQGNLAMALESYNDSLSIPNEDPILVAGTYNNLANIYAQTNQIELAMETFNKAFASYEQLGENSMPSESADVCMNMATIYNLEQEEPALAIKFYFRALTIRKRTLGEDHPQVAVAYNSMGLAYQKVAESQLVEGRDFMELALNPIPDTIQENQNMKEAMSCFANAGRIWAKDEETRHLLADVYHSMAKCCRSLGDVKTALEFYSEALSIKLERAGPDQSAIDLCMIMVQLYEKMGNVEGALETYKKMRELRVQISPGGEQENADTAHTCKNVASLYEKLGKFPQAIEELTRALAIFEKLYPARDPNWVPPPKPAVDPGFLAMLEAMGIAGALNAPPIDEHKIWVDGTKREIGALHADIINQQAVAQHLALADLKTPSDAQMQEMLDVARETYQKAIDLYLVHLAKDDRKVKRAKQRLAAIEQWPNAVMHVAKDECLSGHPITPENLSRRICDMCSESIKPTTTSTDDVTEYACTDCGFDVCLRCHINNHSSSQSVVVDDTSPPVIIVEE